MAAVFCGATNCPMTALMLAFEAVRRESLTLYAVCCGWPICSPGYSRSVQRAEDRLLQGSAQSGSIKSEMILIPEGERKLLPCLAGREAEIASLADQNTPGEVEAQAQPVLIPYGRARQKREKIWACSSSGMPGPLSVTRMRQNNS